MCIDRVHSCVILRDFIDEYLDERSTNEAVEWFRGHGFCLASRFCEMQGGWFRRSGDELGTEQVRCKRILSHIFLPRCDLLTWPP
jgi:hypothetical protein